MELTLSLVQFRDWRPELWRSQPYMDYFEFLDKAGGFYYERWVRPRLTFLRIN